MESNLDESSTPKHLKEISVEENQNDELIEVKINNLNENSKSSIFSSKKSDKIDDGNQIKINVSSI